MAGPKPFTDTLVSLRYGTLSDDLTKALNDLTTKCADSGKQGTLTLKLVLKPGNGGQIEISDDIKVVMPKEVKGSSIFWATGAPGAPCASSYAPLVSPTAPRQGPFQPTMPPVFHPGGLRSIS